MTDYLSLCHLQWDHLEQCNVMSNFHSASAMLSRTLPCEVVKGFVVLMRRDRCRGDAHCLDSGERSGIKTTGLILDFDAVHENSMIGRNRVLV
jgi:hypothetical protein